MVPAIRSWGDKDDSSRESSPVQIWPVPSTAAAGAAQQTCWSVRDQADVSDSFGVPLTPTVAYGGRSSSSELQKPRPLSSRAVHPTPRTSRDLDDPQSPATANAAAGHSFVGDFKIESPPPLLLVDDAASSEVSHQMPLDFGMMA
eukprot:6524541-Prymnesium_polylepis.1